MPEDKDMHVPESLVRLGRLYDRTRGLWIRLGDLETRLLGDSLPEEVDRPVYVCGLARSGTTIILEMLARHPETASHRYRDFPFIFTPVIWDWFYRRAGTAGQEAAERAHKDGIMVTAESPEAMEEMIWAALVPGVHDPGAGNVLGPGASYPRFERAYRDHIRKLLHVRGARRYLAKGNYNLSRMGYLLRLFPGARFVIPVRDPVGHIASLMKQHRLFTEQAARDPRVTEHLSREGHFEFGPGRIPINFGDGAAAAEVARLWQEGEEVRGWARYWAEAYGFAARALSESPELREAAVVIDYRNLCRMPYESLRLIHSHCGLHVGEEALRELAGRIAYPGYYKPSFSDEEMKVIEQETSGALEAVSALVGNR